MTETKHSKLIILGSGPAGYTAAIYAARANLKPILITGKKYGGQLMSTNEIENWPGDSKNLTGPLLIQRMHSHAVHLDIDINFDHITKINLQDKPFLLIGDNWKYICNALIIATGASARYLGLDSEKKFLGKGVSFCAVCDGFFYKNAKVAVIGGGNTAVGEAMYLSNIANEIHLIHRRESFRAEKTLFKNLIIKSNTKNIFLHTNCILDKIIGNETGVTEISLKNIISNKKQNISVTGIFIAIGHKPNTQLFKEQLQLHNGYISIQNHNYTTSTSISGVFAAGDVVDHKYRQAITAAGSGCMAALDAENYLNKYY